MTCPKEASIMNGVPRPNPELIIIGDSLAQGCRSLTVNQAYCAQSWAARIAEVQGWEFVTPDFPRPILFDLEDEVRRLDTLTLSVQNFRFKGLIERFQANLGEWLKNDRESGFPCFDNLGISGALIYELYTQSAAAAAAKIAELTPKGAATRLNIADVGDLHRAINGRFTLNPSQDPAFDSFTQLDWVRARRPRRLLVQIGHNHGLYQIGSEAQDVAFNQSGGDGLHGDYRMQWQTLATNLANLPADVNTIVVALLPKISAVANLDPREADRENGYAPSYGPVLSISTAILPGTRLAEIDQAIRDANACIQQIVTQAATAAGAAGRLKFLDTYALFESFDFKNSQDGERRIAVTDDVSIDNYYVAGRFHLLPLNTAGWRLSAGGFQSIDGMHPSGCGYAKLAAEAINLMELPNKPPDDFLDNAFVQDSLLSHYPVELRAVTSLLQMARDLIRVNSFVPSRLTSLGEELHATDIVRMMQSTFFP
jgi:hypothetical protein